MGINSGVMMENYINFTNDGYNIAKNVYLLAVRELFK